MERNVKNIAVIVDGYRDKSGSSNVALAYVHRLREKKYNAYLISQDNLPKEPYDNRNVILKSTKDWEKFLTNHEVDIIHYIRAAKSHIHSSIFSKFIRAREKHRMKIKTLLTLCQQPSIPSVILTPFEITHSDFIIFIDKTAYTDPLYKFIPSSRKVWMYLTASKKQIENDKLDKFVKKDYEINSNKVVFGRGSVLSKYPKDIIEIYDKIDIPYKKEFIAVGVPDSPNWLTKKVEKRGLDDIITIPKQPLDKYAEIVSKFDIMLYYLPTDTYSSLDGSVRIAQRLGIPTILFGPPAPQEPYINGENGFIAETKEEIIRYAEMLATDSHLRARIGKKARESYIANAPETHWTDRHIEILEDIYIRTDAEDIIIPLHTFIRICIIKYWSWIKDVVKAFFCFIKNLT